MIPFNLEANWNADLALFRLDRAILGRVDRALDRLAPQLKKAEMRHERNEKRKTVTFMDASVLMSEAQAIIFSHAGFDTIGKVTDQTQALKSTHQLSALLGQCRDSLLFKLRSFILSV